MILSFTLLKHSLCLFLFILSFSHSKLIVKSPEDLKSRFDQVNGIDYTVLTPENQITLRGVFIGSLRLPDPNDACNPLDSLNGLNNDALFNPTLLATWGGCHYEQKVKNAETAGAKMVILILGQDMDLNHPAIQQLPISTGVGVLAISKTDGDKMVSYIQDKATEESEPTVEITYTYDAEKPLNFQNASTIVLDFWFSSADFSGTSYEILESLKVMLEGFNDSVEFNPHYVLWRGDNSNIDDSRCVSRGLYCAPEPLTENRLSGKEAVWEDLRQICYRELDNKTTSNSTWWQYVTAFGQNCIIRNADEIQACRDEVTRHFQENAKEAEDCLNREKSENEIEYLKQEIDEKEQMSVDNYPAFYVNKERYAGSFRNDTLIKEFICSHFSQDKIPSACSEPNQPAEGQNPNQTTEGQNSNPPNQPNQPTESQSPNQSSPLNQPTEGQNPSQPNQPSQPTEGQNPNQPHPPSQPGQPSQPTQPAPYNNATHPTNNTTPEERDRPVSDERSRNETSVSDESNPTPSTQKVEMVGNPSPSLWNQYGWIVVDLLIAFVVINLIGWVVTWVWSIYKERQETGRIRHQHLPEEDDSTYPNTGHRIQEISYKKEVEMAERSSTDEL